ncbi:hypothetical protein L7E55_15500 [Pelotomaculum isophthalicicum JI]|uniref:Uncharacterized protein n=1 Tax=Pelotomaculum isophthalicicum JI TaxID=947010 RepID=A0A9X4H752_9FIRM|nr:hypothetical protein [Pelotomaculum isophthalicicum]MDF9409737.1 hypothetical protein [Pelotomaculum isophthalicicum JI]
MIRLLKIKESKFFIDKYILYPLAGLLKKQLLFFCHTYPDNLRHPHPATTFPAHHHHPTTGINWGKFL